MAQQGTAVGLSSTDTDELVALCDRVIVFHKGQIIEVLSNQGITSSAISQAVLAENSTKDGKNN
jgi:ABC-type sugar transport system ATPase subunit